jgi:hypothetical protein
MEYWNGGILPAPRGGNIGLKEKKAGEVAFPGFALLFFQPNIPTFHYSILPPFGLCPEGVGQANVTGAPKKMEIPMLSSYY